MMFEIFRKSANVAVDQPPIQKVARLYAYEGNLYICRVRWISEVGIPEVFPETVDDEILGNAVLAHLDAFDPSEFDIRNVKRTDWPAFKASGAKSVKAFERQAWFCDASQRGSNFEVSAGPCFTLKEDLTAQASVSPADPQNVATAIRDALGGARVMRAEGIL